jgi:hypothetical protein
MSTEKLLRTPVPIDATAARVIRGGAHWAPGICNSQPVFDIQPPVMALPRDVKKNPTFIDLTGKRFGTLQVIGYAKDQTKRKTKGATWVCRCTCGLFITRHTPAIKTANREDTCPRCSAKRKIRGVLSEEASVGLPGNDIRAATSIGERGAE